MMTRTPLAASHVKRKRASRESVVDLVGLFEPHVTQNRRTSVTLFFDCLHACLERFELEMLLFPRMNSAVSEAVFGRGRWPTRSKEEQRRGLAAG